jgi:thioredoxin 1
MSVVHLENANDISTGKSVLKFSAEWCGPCKNIAPYYHTLAEEFKSISFYEIDVDRSEDITDTFKVTSMPTFVTLQKGKEVERVQGADKNKLRKLVENLDATN